MAHTYLKTSPPTHTKRERETKHRAQNVAGMIHAKGKHFSVVMLAVKKFRYVVPNRSRRLQQYAAVKGMLQSELQRPPVTQTFCQEI